VQASVVPVGDGLVIDTVVVFEDAAAMEARQRPAPGEPSNRFSGRVVDDGRRVEVRIEQLRGDPSAMLDWFEAWTITVRTLGRPIERTSGTAVDEVTARWQVAPFVGIEDPIVLVASA
jgi:fermentation-respiration switch protein FrsA (DUF1100 family)